MILTCYTISTMPTDCGGDAEKQHNKSLLLIIKIIKSF